MADKILVVEDDAMLAELATMVLTKEGFLVQVVTDGLSALEAAVSWCPDLILLDVMMPGMHGYSVAAHLREVEATAQTPIIMLTAKSSIEDKARGFDAGADDYITKPFDNTELLLRIGAHLRRARHGVKVEPARVGSLIATFSLRGGSGCSSLAVNIATGLTLLWRAPVALVDFSLPVGTCDVMLNLKPRHTLDGLARQDLSQIGFHDIEGFLTQHETGVHLLSGIVDPADSDLITEKLIAFILRHLQQHYKYVVADIPHDFSDASLVALERADQIVMPITPDITSVRGAVAALKTFDEINLSRDRLCIVLNATFSEHGFKPDRMERVLTQPLSQVILHDEAWTEAINLGRPVILNDPDTPPVTMLEDLVWRVSRAEDRDLEPQKPGEMWKRVARRQKSTAH